MNPYIKWITTNIFPLASACAVFILWVDARYMLRDMSDARFLDIRITMVEREVVRHERKVDKDGYVPTVQENREYSLLVTTLGALEKERNKVLGLQEDD